MKVELSPLASSIVAEIGTYLRRAYDVDFTPEQIVSAMISAGGVEGAAETFGLLLRPKDAPTTAELALEQELAEEAAAAPTPVPAGGSTLTPALSKTA